MRVYQSSAKLHFIGVVLLRTGIRNLLRSHSVQSNYIAIAQYSPVCYTHSVAYGVSLLTVCVLIVGLCL